MLAHLLPLFFIFLFSSSSLALPHPPPRPLKRLSDDQAFASLPLLPSATSSYLTSALNPSFSPPDLHGQLHSKPKLVFRNDGTFKVVSFSDLHFGEAEDQDWGIQQDVNTRRVLDTILELEKPDFVIFNGDLITGENTQASNSTSYLDQVFAAAVERNIPFSCTYGNHDNAPNINHEQILEYEQAHFPLSYTRSDVGPRPYGLGNYWLPIYQSSNDTIPAAILWAFDSRGFVSNSLDGPNDWVDEQTVPDWIARVTSSMKTLWSTIPPSLAFVHIPPHPSHPFASLPSPGHHFDSASLNAQGDSSAGGAYHGQDGPFFQALIGLVGGGDAGGRRLMGVVSGHDHGENWCAKGDESGGVPICFNGHAGYGGYSEFYLRSARVFNFHLFSLNKTIPELETWSRYEDGEIGERSVLPNV